MNSSKEMAPRPRVAVVGAGPGGISTAIALHQPGRARYDAQRVWYTNKQAVMARRMGHLFHRLPRPLSALRDAVFNHTRFLERVLVQDYLKDAEDQMLALEFGAGAAPGSAS